MDLSNIHLGHHLINLLTSDQLSFLLNLRVPDLLKQSHLCLIKRTINTAIIIKGLLDLFLARRVTSNLLKLSEFIVAIPAHVNCAPAIVLLQLLTQLTEVLAFGNITLAVIGQTKSAHFHMLYSHFLLDTI